MIEAVCKPLAIRAAKSGRLSLLDLEGRWAAEDDDKGLTWAIWDCLRL